MAFDIHDTRSNPYALAVSIIASAFAVGNVILGIILWAEPERVIGGSFAWIAYRAPIGAWAATFAACGAVALFGQYAHRKWPARLAHTGSALACLYWAGAFWHAAEQSGTPRTGCLAYGLIGVTHILIAVFSPHRARQ